MELFYMVAKYTTAIDGPELPEPKTIGDYVKPEYYWR
jgi:hypothetical protein